jgi:excisionase family DNA binding protein
MSLPRFLQLADVAEVLNISAAQAYALVRSGELPAIKIGGRGQWRVEATELEAYIQRLYAETRQFVAAHPFGARGDDELGPGLTDEGTSDGAFAGLPVTRRAGRAAAAGSTDAARRDSLATADGPA